MQTVMGKTYYQVPRFETLRDLIHYSVEQYGDTPAYRYHDKPGGPDVVRTTVSLARRLMKWARA